MIIAHIIGGLGNQMFQYAAGRALSIRHGVPLRLDISDFMTYDLHHGFELDRVFACCAGIADELDLRATLGWQHAALARRYLARQNLALFRRNEFVVEPHFHYWSGINKAPRNCYLMGYWQSEKYFADAAAEIRKDFSFKAPLANQNVELAGQIRQTNAVSLHVRRGDYVNNPKTTAKHGLCSLDYYRSAIRFIAARVEQPCFYIFSDDIPWVKENLEIEFPCRYVDHNPGAESYNDMHLMSMCGHHIIANSSFSWWGAWLNPDPDKIVVAPHRWFANDNDVSDLFPRAWVTL